MSNSIFMLSRYLKKPVTTALILGLMLSPILPAAQGVSSSVSIATQAAELETEAEDAAQAEDVVAIGDWYAVANVAWYYADTNAASYDLTTPEELAGLAYLVNVESIDFAGQTIKIANDIDLGGRYWIPIGLGSNTNYTGATASVRKNSTDVFRGIFDGQGYTISNMTIGTSAEEPANYETTDLLGSDILSCRYYGLFGLIDNAMITNVNVKLGQIYVSDSASVGAICGYAKDSTISDCSSSMLINSDYVYYVGGICGLISNSKVNDCVYFGSISATGEAVKVGGICSYIEEGSEINNCSNDSNSISIPATDGQHIEAGGICCEAVDSTINKCNNNASIIVGSNMSEPLFAGICSSATNSNITNSSNYGNIVSRYQRANGRFTRKYILGGIGANISSSIIANCANYGEITSDLNSSKLGGICGSVNEDSIIDNCFNAEVVSFTDPNEDIPAGQVCYEIKDSEITNTYYLFAGNGLGEVGTVEKEKSDTAGANPITEREATASPQVEGNLLNKLNENVNVNNADPDADLVYDYWVTKDGLNDNYPYINYNCWTDKTEDGNGYRYADTSWYDENPGENAYTIDSAAKLAGLAVLVNDRHIRFFGVKITLEEDIDLSGHNWEPIGIGAFEFLGRFDGNDKTIDNMNININSNNSLRYVGLFGILKGTVCNLTIGENSKINVYDNNSENQCIGGICGEVKDEGAIRDCTNKSKINVNNTYPYSILIGGICGSFDASIIYECTNVGDISSNTSKTGGIYGYNWKPTETSIVDCTNTGHISAPDVA